MESGLVHEASERLAYNLDLPQFVRTLDAASGRRRWQDRTGCRVADGPCPVCGRMRVTQMKTIKAVYRVHTNDSEADADPVLHGTALVLGQNLYLMIHQVRCCRRCCHAAAAAETQHYVPVRPPPSRAPAPSSHILPGPDARRCSPEPAPGAGVCVCGGGGADVAHAAFTHERSGGQGHAQRGRRVAVVLRSPNRVRC